MCLDGDQKQRLSGNYCVFPLSCEWCGLLRNSPALDVHRILIDLWSAVTAAYEFIQSSVIFSCYGEAKISRIILSCLMTGSNSSEQMHVLKWFKIFRLQFLIWCFLHFAITVTSFRCAQSLV